MRRRVAALGATLALQAGFVAALLTLTLSPPLQRREVEVVMQLFPDPKPPAAAPGAAATSGVYQIVPIWIPPADWKMPPTGALRRVLAECNLETLRRLPPEDRDACRKWLGYGPYRAADGTVEFKATPGRRENELRVSDIQARRRNVADPCLIAKESGTECIHTVLYGDRLP